MSDVWYIYIQTPFLFTHGLVPFLYVFIVQVVMDENTANTILAFT
jgi:hypothetical protein